MAPPRTAKTTSSAPGQPILRRSRNTHNQDIGEIDEDTHADQSMGDDGEVEDGDVVLSQGTAVQNMITGSISNVRQDVLVRGFPTETLTIPQQKKRHIVNKKQVKEKYSRTKTELHDNITALFEEHEEQA